MQRKPLIIAAAILLAFLCTLARAAELVTLDANNWDQFAPKGKEVDAIYGDYVLAGDKIVAVVAQAVDTRHANLTVRNVGGSIIDLATREQPNDQLGAFYPHTGEAKLEGPIDWTEAFGDDANNGTETKQPARLAFRLVPATASTKEAPAPLQITIGYELADATDHVTVITKVTNPNTTAMPAALVDSIRADGEFQFGFEDERDLWWAHDRFWGQAYGTQPVGEFSAVGVQPEQGRSRRTIEYKTAGGSQVMVPPNGSVIVKRRLFPASDTLALQAFAARERGVVLTPLEITVRDPQGRVADAEIELHHPSAELYGAARTNDDGVLVATCPPGQYHVLVNSHGRKVNVSFDVLADDPERNTFEISLPPCGYVDADITDDTGKQIACRVAFFGEGDTPNPYFGPNSAIYGVKNLQHTPDGRFRVPLVPGRYQVVITHGPEYDAILKTIEVAPGETTAINEKLARTVDTAGWLSADFHSHSSPSGDNTASQRGRVLNLLAEHIEFGPCTEHNRIDSYVPHLKFFKAEDRMATCCGIELTGQPLPINHQNAFPLVERPHTQDGGGPITHVDPVVQIERLAMWDDAADKLVQINHPNIVQMIGDRDLNGAADGGFERMFHFMDVIEVHPPTDIFRTPTELASDNKKDGVAMFNWLQLLNLGYRVPGVVNTDAHWNYYGSGGLRNYIRSTTDNPADARIEDLVRESELGHIVITNGPFLEVEARAAQNETANGDGPRALPGDELAAADGNVTLHVRVQCPNWIQVNRVQLFVNGRPLDEHNYTARRHASMFRSGPLIFDEQLPVSLPADAHIVVAVAGEGTQLGLPYGTLDTNDRYATSGATMPVAVANPIFVDTDGDGFQANGDTLGLPLPISPEQRPSHGHDHENFHRDRQADDGVAGVEPKASPQ